MSSTEVEKKEKKEKKHRTPEEKERHEKKKLEKKEKREKKDKDGKEKEKKPKEKREKKHKPKKAKDDADSMSEGDESDTRPIEERYDLGAELGRGAFSIVKEATSKRSGKRYAIKIIEKQNAGQDMVRLRTEIEILKSVKHPSIIALKEMLEDDKTLYIVTELVTGGELFDKIVELGAYSESDAAALVAKMVSAIEYLHSKGIVHRDLKPENLLLKSDENVRDIKLADFGLSKIVNAQMMMQTACGTPGYVAPEVLNASGYDKEVDLWSIGVITYILLCGFPPFYNESLPLLFEQILKADFDYPADYWETVSDTAKDFINKLLVVEPSKRLTAQQALEHPWLAGQAPSRKLNVKAKMDTYLKDHRSQAAPK